MTTLDKFSLDLLVRQERYLRDVGEWTRLRSLWLNDTASTHVDISWVKGTIEDFINGGAAMHKQSANPFQTSCHQLQPLDIRINGERAFVVTSNHVMIRSRHKNGVEYDMDSWGHQLQTFVKVDEEWKFRSFEQIYIKDSVTPAYPQSAAAVAELEAEFAEWRDTRSSIKCLSWSILPMGKTVRDDIPGYDDEKTWKPVMERHDQWLRTGQGW